MFPALIINYLGQAALILNDPAAVSNPFYLLAPGWARWPLVVLATVATVIASQAVISGAFSVSRQAVRLGYLPHLTVRHTSTVESGQIYVPAVNWLLFAGVLVLMVVFQSSNKLATAYGVAVTGTLVINTTLFLMFAAIAWRWATWKLVLGAVVFGGVELIFLSANLAKIVEGGWLPLLVAALVVTVMTTWQRGRKIITARRVDVEGPLPEFVDRLDASDIPRVPGTAVFPHPTKLTRAAGAAGERRVQPRAARAGRHRVGDVGERAARAARRAAGARRARQARRRHRARVGALRVPGRAGPPAGAPRRPSGLSDELDIDPDAASYFLSRMTIERGRQPGMSGWRKRMFIGLSHNAANPAAYFCLPVDRTVVMGSRIEL